MKPLISVVITNYNYEQYVKKAIQSVIDQTYRNIELIVYDDGSTDNSIAVIETILSYQELSKVKFIKQENQGIVKTRNRALNELTGEYYIFLDADDYFDPDFIMKMYQVACESNADIVYPNWHIIEVDTGKDYRVNFENFSIDALQRQKIHITPESLVKTSAISGVYFESEFIAEDWQFFLQLGFLNKRFVLSETCFINYQIKGNSRSSSHSYTEDTFAFEEILDKFRDIYGDRVIESGYLIQKRMSELEVDRQAIKGKLSVSERNLVLLSKSNDFLSQEIEYLTVQNRELEESVFKKDVHIYNLENSKLGKIQHFLRKRMKK